MYHTSHIEISKSALRQNLDFIRKTVKKGVQISSVIKGDAYGHGIDCFVPVAESLGVNHFSVFSADEAELVLKASNKKSTIVIMGMIENSALKWAIKNDIEFFVFEEDRLEKAIESAKKLNKKAKIHIEIETGLNRTGFTKNELENVLPKFKSEHIEIIGLCTHFAGAESVANYYRIKQQRKNYNQIHKWLQKKGIEPKIRHTACSAAIIRYPDTQLDMVRIGILQYGFWPSTETFIHYITKRKNKQTPIERILSWKSTIMSIKTIGKGEFVSYGTTFLSEKEMSIATIPVGYSHGYARSLSNMGRVLINGARISVIGIVNMNMILVDVTDLPNVKKGDEVILIGKQNDLEITVASFSELSNQLNYELLTRLPKEIPRKIIA